MYVVTGGAGFIGSHLVRELVRRGERVRVLDNLSSSDLSRLASVAQDVEFMEGDVRDAEAVRRALDGAEIVLHQAAVASVPRSIAEPEATHAANITGTINVLEAARASGVRRVIFASSSAVYGNLADTPKNEGMPTVPLSPYGVQKLASEAYCRIWYSIYGLETVALRYFNVFGPDQDPQSEYAAVIPRFITAALAGNRPVIYGDGEQSRDFIYVGDVVAANLLAATHPAAPGMVMNVGTGRQATLNQLITAISEALGQSIKPVYEPARAGDVRESLADISLITSTLGFTPAMTLAQGLAAAIRTYAN